MSDTAQIYESGSPNVDELSHNYKETLAELYPWLDQCRRSYDDRRNIWGGKSDDLRKGGADAVPFEGAADNESMVCGTRINAYISLCMFALNRAHIRAYPVEVGDVARSRIVSGFLKWMRDSYIPEFARECELAANYLFEKGISVTCVGWEQREVTRLQTMDLEQIGAVAPDFAEMVMDESNDDQIVAMLQSQFPKLTTRRAKKVLRKLRKEGIADLPISVKAIDRPCVKALAPDSEVFFPHYCTDPQNAPYVHWRVLMTPQELLAKVATEGWDKKWAEKIIETQRGDGTRDLGEHYDEPVLKSSVHDNDFIEVIYSYQRLIAEDGAEGIYCTVWNKRHTVDNAHAKYELLNGLDNYPFLVTELHRDNKRMYDVSSMVDLLRGVQWIVKSERDSRCDRSSIATLPPSKGPVGRPKPELRPGGHITERRAGEYSWMDAPALDSGSIEVEQTLLNQADEMVGLSDPATDPDASIKRAFYLNKFLGHVRDVIREAYKCYLRYGPDEILFRVSGVPEPQQFQKGSADSEDMDISIHFDSQMSDPETVEKKLASMLQLVQFDRTGKIDVESMLEFAAAAIDPVLAEQIIQPQEAGAAKIAKEVAEDLSKIYSGIEVGARPTGSQIALQIGQNYAQVPDVQQRLQQDEAFAERLTKYFDQHQFQITQQQNAEIGRLGTEPAAFQGVNNQQ